MPVLITQLGQREIILLKGRIEFQVDNTQLVRSAGANVSVMVLQGCKSSPQKSRPVESGHRRHAVWIAIEYSYRRVKLLGVAHYYIIYRSRDHTIGSHFVGQKKNEINRVTPISQHSNEVLRTRNS